MTAPGAAYEPAVEAMALALEETNDGGYAVGWDTLARAGLAALVASEDVRAALAEALTHVPCKRFPSDHWCGDGGNLSDVDHPQHPTCLTAAALAALSRGEAT